MDAGLKKVLGRIGDFWKKLSTRLKVLLILLLVGAITAIAIISAVSSRTQYVLLYSGLSDSESGEIVSELQTKDVKYKLEGNDIYVDKSVADETRMTLAVDGYPETTLDYSIYSSGSTWTMTDSDKKTLYQYQTQNRLQDTIKTIPGVKNAIVTITQSDDDTYVLSSDEEPVTASVKLTLKDGVTLTSKQVTGIVNIVRYSVSGLTADNVTVEDSDGNTLNGDDATDSLSTTQYALRKSVENQIKSTLLPVLEKVYGEGNVQIVPAVTIDATTTSTKSFTYSSPNGDGQGVVSSVSESNTVSGSGLTSTASGTVGVNEAEPEYTTSSSSATSVVSGVETQRDYSATYLYNQVEQEVEDSGGSIKDMTIAVVLNSGAQAVATADADEVKATVAAAAGTNTYSTTDAYVGNGVDSSNVTQARDTFLDGRYRDSNSLYSDYDTRNDLLSQVEDIFNEIPSGDSDDLVGLSGSVSDLITSLSSYQEQPNDTVTDQDVQSAVSDVVLKIKNDYNNLDSFETSEAAALTTIVTGSSDGSVTTGGINGILTKITNLNTQIAAQELGGDSANDLRDQRNTLLDELSGYVDITSVEQSDGKVTVKLTGDSSGAMLIDSENHAHTLAVTSDSTSIKDSNDTSIGTYTTYGITWDPDGTYNKGNSTYVSSTTTTGNAVTISSGSVNGYLSVLNGTGDGTGDYGDVGVVYLKQRLNDFAKSFADTMNSVANTYSGATSGTQSLLTYTADTAGTDSTAANVAANISLSSAWTNDSSTFSTLFTDGQNSSSGLSDYAQAFYNALNSDKSTATYYTSGTLQQYADTFSNSVATVKSNASDYSDYYNTTATNLDTQRQSVSSVSIDEESINLIKYQQAYSASARVVTTINNMMETLLAMGQ